MKLKMLVLLLLLLNRSSHDEETCRASSVLLFPTFWGLSYFFLLLGKIPTFSYFLGGLSLHLNHLIASRVANYYWPFGTLPFGLFGSNLDTRDLKTYPRTYSGHF